jgi:hypothetical protein
MPFIIFIISGYPPSFSSFPGIMLSSFQDSFFHHIILSRCSFIIIILPLLLLINFPSFSLLIHHLQIRHGNSIHDFGSLI